MADVMPTGVDSSLLAQASALQQAYKNQPPYQPLYPYNGTIETGGTSTQWDLNLYYNAGDIAWMMCATALVFLQIPGVGFFYSGLARRKSALSLLWLALMAAGVVSFQWFVWGYSLAFSHHATAFWGKLDNVGLKNVLGQPSLESLKIPDLVYGTYQCMFAIFTNAIMIGAAAERGRMFPAMVFMFVWTTLVYCPIAEWTWNVYGWGFALGAFDFAGGGPVHIASGCSALAYSYVLGRRKGHGTYELNYRPHNIVNIVLGCVLLWAGWFGLNGGSALGANLRGVMAIYNTNLAAGFSGLSWMLMDFRLEKKWSTVGFCSGVVAGLVCITPGAGFVPPWAAPVFGLVGGATCNLATGLKYYLRADDAMDIFAIHAVGGYVGMILTGIFAADYISPLDGFTYTTGGWLNRQWIQVAYQLALASADAVWAFGVSMAILIVMNFIPWLKLRATEEQETAGMDDAELGEFAYDYVETSRESEKVHEPSVTGFPTGNGETTKDKPVGSIKPLIGAPLPARPVSPSVPPGTPR